MQESGAETALSSRCGLRLKKLVQEEDNLFFGGLGEGVDSSTALLHRADVWMGHDFTLLLFFSR